MNQPQKVQLFKSKRDAIIDVASLAVFTGMVYLVMNPGACDKMSEALNKLAETLENKVSVWQTKLAIRSLPETDDR